MLQQISRLVVPLISLVIKAYRSLLSPLLGRHCRFYPSCSQYMQTAVERFGVLRGMFLGAKRISRCHPFSDQCGYDPLPEAR